MNDRQLKYLLTLADEGNMTSAAQKLNISQPSLSAMLSSVEDELGIKLFKRQPLNMLLTSAGKCYIEAAQNILCVTQDLKRKISEIQEFKRGIISIGCGRQLSAFLFPRIIPAFRQKYPGLTVQLVEDSLPVLHNMLCSGELDVVFTYSQINNEYLEHLPFFDEEVLLFTHPTYQTSATKIVKEHMQPVIDFSEMKNKAFVLFKKGNLLRDMINSIFNDFGVSPNIVLETDIWQTCISMVAAGEAFTLLPYHSIMKDSHNYSVKSYSLDGHYFRHVSLSFHKNFPQQILDGLLLILQNCL